MREVTDSVLLELTSHEVMTLRDALLYFAEFSSDDLHQSKAKRASDLRTKLLEAFISDDSASGLRTVSA